MLSISDLGLDDEQLETIKSIAADYDTDPNLILAIGWHETQWGKLGDGRKGMYTGYGSFDSGSDYSYSGFEKQVKGTAWKMHQWGITPGNVDYVTLQLGQKGLLPSGIYATDSGWLDAVYNYYHELINTGGISSQTSYSDFVTAQGETVLQPAPQGGWFENTWNKFLDIVGYDKGMYSGRKIDSPEEMSAAMRAAGIDTSGFDWSIQKVRDSQTTPLQNSVAAVTGAVDALSDPGKWVKWGVILLLALIAVFALFMAVKGNQTIAVMQPAAE